MRRSSLLPGSVLLMMASLFAGGCASSAGPDSPGTPVQGASAAEVASRAMSREEAVQIFDSAWSRIGNSYYDTTFGGRSWDGVREEFLPRAEAAGTEARLRDVIQDMLDGIGDSHFALIPREAADALDPSAIAAGTSDIGVPGDLGMEVRVLEGMVTVVRVEEDSPAGAAGVQPGWVLEAVGDRNLEEVLATLRELEAPMQRTLAQIQISVGVNGALQGPAGSELELTFQDSAGDSRTLTLTRREAPGELIRMGNLPALLARLEYERVTTSAGCIGIIEMGIWLAPLAAAFDRAVNELRDCQGIVLDLRGNPGGGGGMVMGAAGHFVDEVVPLGIMQSRGMEMRFVTNPRRVDPQGNPVQVFGGPVAVLVDGLSMSTSEIFAAGMQSLGRARIFGTPTPGQALPSALVRLPNGDVLQHAIADFTTPDGTRIEGMGVIPDEEVPLTRELLLQGGDPALDTALRWIRGQAPTP